MSSIYENDPAILIDKRKGDQTSPYVDMNESLVVNSEGKMILSEIPHKYERVLINSSDNKQWYEIEEGLPSDNQFLVDYENKIITFNLSNKGKQLNAVYKGTGNHYYSTNSIYVSQSNGKVTETLKDLTNTTTEARELSKQQNIDFKSQEDVRVSQENSRKTAESSRVSVESSRVSAENTRVSQENSRKTAETGRTDAENLRVTNEQNRQSMESQRVIDENVRKTAEGLRNSAEQTRVNNENLRQQQETKRQTDTSAAIANAQSATQSANTAASNANQAADSTRFIWKESVSTFAELATKYPTPQNGWTVIVNDTAQNTKIRYRYESAQSKWVAITQEANGQQLVISSIPPTDDNVLWVDLSVE